MPNKKLKVTHGFALSNVLLHRSRSAVIGVEDSGKIEGSSGLNFLSIVQNNTIKSHLRVKLVVDSPSITSNSPFKGIHIDFCILGIFDIPVGASSDEIDMFAKYISIGALIPHAREFSSDIARRMGIMKNPMPLYEPQSLVKLMDENNSIEVRYKEDDENVTSDHKPEE